MGNKTSLSQDNQHTSTKLQGDVSFTDVDGKPIFLGDIIEQMNFNGVPYMARYKVVFDPEENEVCLLLISGNEKAMQNSGYRYFGEVVNGRLRKGRVVGHID